MAEVPRRRPLRPAGARPGGAGAGWHPCDPALAEPEGLPELAGVAGKLERQHLAVLQAQQRDGAALALFAASKPAIRRLRMDSPPVVSSPIFLAETGFLKMIKNVQYDGDDCK